MTENWLSKNHFQIVRNTDQGNFIGFILHLNKSPEIQITWQHITVVVENSQGINYKRIMCYTDTYILNTSLSVLIILLFFPSGTNTFFFLTYSPATRPET